MMSGSTQVTTFYFSTNVVITVVGVIAIGIVLQIVAPELVSSLQEHWLWFIAGAAIVGLVASYIQMMIAHHQPPPQLPKMFVPRPFTFEQLSLYDGSRNSTTARVASSSSFSSSSKKSRQDGKEQQEHPIPLYENKSCLCRCQRRYL